MGCSQKRVYVLFQTVKERVHLRFHDLENADSTRYTIPKSQEVSKMLQFKGERCIELLVHMALRSIAHPLGMAS